MSTGRPASPVCSQTGGPQYAFPQALKTVAAVHDPVCKQQATGSTQTAVPDQP